MTAWASRLFPDPLAPTTATISPLRILRSRSVTAWISFRPKPRSYWVKDTDRPFTVRISSSDL